MNDEHDPDQEPADAAVPASSETTEPTSPFVAVSAPGTAYQAAEPTSPLSYVFFAGLVILLAGLIWWHVEAETTTALVIWLFAGFVAVLSPLAWHAVDIGQVIGGRRGVAFLFVLMTVGLGGIGLAAISAINYTLHERGDLPFFDATATGEFTLSAETSQLFGEIKGTVYLTYLENLTPPGYRERALNQLRIYQHSFANVEFQRLDPQGSPSDAEQRMRAWGIVEPPRGEQDDMIIVTYAEPGREITRGLSKEVRVDPVGWTQRSALGEEQWLGERVISSAVREIVFEEVKAYVTGGHGEQVFGAAFRGLRERLAGQNITLEEQPLQIGGTASFPEDCDILFVMNPRRDFTATEEDALERWLDSGNKTLFLTLEVEQSRRDLGLKRLLGNYGMEPRNDYCVYAPIIDQTIVSKRMEVAGFTDSVPASGRGGEYADHPAVRALRANAGLATEFLRSCYIAVLPQPPSGIEVEAVVRAPHYPRQPGMTVDPQSVAARQEPGRTRFVQAVPGKDVIGQKLPLVVAARKELPARAGSPATASRVVVVGDTDCFGDVFVAAGHASNLDLAVGLIQWGLQREGLVSISPQTLAPKVVQMTPRKRRVALWWPIGTALLPLILGAAVWWARRR